MKTQIFFLSLFLLIPIMGFSQYPDQHVGGIALEDLNSNYVTVRFKRYGKTTLPNSTRRVKAYRVLISHGSDQTCKLWEEFEKTGVQYRNPCTGLRNKANAFIKYARPEEFLNQIEALGWEMEEEFKRKNRIRGSHHLMFIYQKKDS